MNRPLFFQIIVTTVPLFLIQGSNKAYIRKQDGIRVLISALSVEDPDVQKNILLSLSLLVEERILCANGVDAARRDVHLVERIPKIIAALESQHDDIRDFGLVILARCAVESSVRQRIKTCGGIAGLVHFSETLKDSSLGVAFGLFAGVLGDGIILL